MSKQQSDIGGRIANTWEKGRVESYDTEEFAQPAFHYLDEAMKLYFSDIRIPTKDSTRFLKVKIAGTNKAVQVWTEELKHGRAQLPVMSISRGAHNFNPDKFSPAKHPMRRLFTNIQKTRVKFIFRPVPLLVDYTITILAEHKRDAEYALQQILTRYNPIAEFRCSDSHISGCIQLRPAGTNDISDKEVSAEQWAKVKYEITTTAEAWLALPEQTKPTVINVRGSYRIGEDVVNFERFNLSGVQNG